MPKYLAQVDLSKIPIKGLVPESSGTAPSAPVEGQQWYDSTNKKTMAYQNGFWVDLSANTSFTTGTVAQIAAGTDTQSQVWKAADLKTAIVANAPNTTYTVGTPAQIAAGTDTTSQVWKAADLKTSIVANSAAASSSNPIVDGTAAPGVATTYARGDHVHPTDTSRLAVSAFTAQVPASTTTGGQYLRSNGTAGQATWTTPTSINADLSSTAAGNALAGNIGVSGVLPVTMGGTGSTTAAAARTALGAAPTASPTFTGTVTVPTPTNGTDAANKSYVDGAVQTSQQGLDAKQSVVAASTVSIAALNGSSTITLDGILVVSGDRVLIKNQTDGSQNGIYTVTPAAWTRTADFDTWTEIVSAYVFVEQGTTQADTGWVCTADTGGGTVGTTPFAFVQFSGAGVITAGAGLTKTGNVLSIGTGQVVGTMISDLSITDAKISAAAAINGSKLADTSVIAGTKVTGLLPVSKGGTNAVDARGARGQLQATGQDAQPITVALTAGTWTNIPADWNTFQIGAIEMPALTFYDATSHEVVYVDYRVNSGQIQVRTDVAVAANALYCAVISQMVGGLG
jgi:hypothetical protein